MGKVFLVTLLLLLTVVAQQLALAAYCRFASTSASQGKCIFPCRCTNGCDTTTGKCIDNGQCKDGLPTGYRWSGPACQTGNVAYHKSASESVGPAKWAEKFPAWKAIDGDMNPSMFAGSCAHPDIAEGKNAWWMVDFGEICNISKVIIYNRGDSNAERLDTFILSVGDSPDRTAHIQCASHNGHSGATVEVTCRGVARYLSFRRDGGAEPHVTALCEVVVLGHRHMSCRYCPSRCDEIIGCDACDRGKQQPDCTKECERGIYGVNCEEDCGHCKATQQCDVKNGHCATGCETWYATNLCKTHISAPYFVTSDQPDIEEISSSSAIVTWPMAKGITPGLESHYYYIVWFQVDGHTSWDSQTVGVESQQLSFGDIPFNTNYLVKIEPFRRHDDKHAGGTTTTVTRFKTKCIAPDTPAIENVKPSAKNASVGASILVIWKKIAHSGCDALQTVGVAYRHLKPKSDKWSWKYAEDVTSTQLMIRHLDNEEYELKVTAFNNEGISSSSKITKATPSPNPTTASMMTSGGSGSGLAAGVSVGVIIVLALVCAAIFFLVRRRRLEQNKRGTNRVHFSSGRHQRNSGRAHNQDDGEENDGFETERAGDGDRREETEQEKVAGPEYVNTQQVTRGVAVADFAAYVEGKRRQDGFQGEFEELPSGIRHNCTAAKKPQNKNKNRFQDIIAYDHTRVVLTADRGQGDYINANYIMGYNDKKRAYIACQGPRNTTIEAMWRMVWQVKSNTIVMLANLVENGKDKCNQYWPEKNGRRSWGHFITESVSEEKVADYVVRQFSLRNQETGEVRRIRQLHFTNWPDRGTPQYAYPLLAFRRKVHSFDRAIRGPLVVHCSAGVGRTGTFMAIDILIQQAAVESKIDVFQCVNQLRTQRMNMVQTLEQYVFVYQAMIESSQATVMPCSTLRQTFDELCRNRQIGQQFERLSALKPLAKRGKCDALELNNLGKNRNIDIIPDDQHRPYLQTPWKGNTNYVNAVFVHGYKELNAYIVTQSPMASTVVDLWRLLADHECRTVVMLDDCDVTDDQCAIYWPTKEGATHQFGPFQVQLVQTVVSATSNITVREFNLTKPGSSPTVVKQFHVTGGWSQGASLPSNKSVVLELLGLVEKWQQMNGNGPVTVHCSDGASRCGLACAAGYMLEHLKVEQEVDVFHAVQHIRTTRPQLVTDKDQYRFLYEIALEYMSQFDEYANFH